MKTLKIIRYHENKKSNVIWIYFVNSPFFNKCIPADFTYFKVNI